MRTHNTGVVSSIPPCVTFKTPLARKETQNRLMNATLEPSLVSATLEIEYATQFKGSLLTCIALLCSSVTAFAEIDLLG